MKASEEHRKNVTQRMGRVACLLMLRYTTVRGRPGVGEQHEGGSEGEQSMQPVVTVDRLGMWRRTIKLGK